MASFSLSAAQLKKPKSKLKMLLLKTMVVVAAVAVLATREILCLSMQWLSKSHEAWKEMASMETCREQFNGRVVTIQLLGSDLFLTAINESLVDLRPRESSSHDAIRWRTICTPWKSGFLLQSVRYKDRYLYYFNNHVYLSSLLQKNLSF